MGIFYARGCVAMQVVVAFGLVLTAFLTAGASLVMMQAYARRNPARGAAIFDDRTPGTVFLFDGESLVDGSPAARSLLASLKGTGGAWPRLMQHLQRLFPDLETRLARLPETGVVDLLSAPGAGPAMMLVAEARGGLTRLQLSQPGAQAAGGIDPFTHQALSQEVTELRQTLDRLPAPAWREGPGGEVIWANSAYLLQAMDRPAGEADLTWPLPALFEAGTEPLKPRRAGLPSREGKTKWFDLTRLDDPEDGNRLCYALPADAAVQAEVALRDFMQTLTKTFAQLPIGLAIFDSQRLLQLFNPALLDLTGLPPDFLMLRPSLLAVLDALRDRRMLPEPKDYRGWRRQLVEMERAASQGLYEETWALPDGQTFRVTGRPHPNGALALMIEDISTEMLRTRRYRADLELGQSVIDAMDEAVAVFSREGHLVMTNAAYATLWGDDPSETLADVSVRSLAGQWRTQTAPSPLWAEVEDYVGTVGDRLPWNRDTRLGDGRRLSCRIAPLSGGATLVGFRADQADDAMPPALSLVRA